MTDERESDARLAERIRAGQAQALGELYDRYAGTALAVALRVVADRTEAEDVVHDAFVAVWRKIDRFDAGRGSLRAWLLTVVRNRAIDRVRARRVSVDVDDADERSLLRTGPNPTWEDALRRTSATEVRAALDGLPEEQRPRARARLLRGLHVPRGGRDDRRARRGRLPAACGWGSPSCVTRWPGRSGAPLPASRAHAARGHRAMTPMTCAQVDELAGAYALGAVEADEDRAISAHLATCDRPHGEARELIGAGGAMGVAEATRHAEPGAARSR